MQKYIRKKMDQLLCSIIIKENGMLLLQLFLMDKIIIASVENKQQQNFKNNFGQYSMS